MILSPWEIKRFLFPRDLFVQENDTYYGNAEFYDYYSNYELKGISLSTLDASYYGKIISSVFNDAAEDYYEEAGSEKALYLSEAPDKPNKDRYQYGGSMSGMTGTGREGRTSTPDCIGHVDR